MTAKNLDDLLSDVLPTLFRELMPGFGVIADGAHRNLDGHRAPEGCCFDFAGAAALEAR